MDLSAFRGGADNAAAYEALVGTTGTIPSPSFLPKVAPLAAPAGALSDPEAVAELRKLVEARLATLDADAQKMVEAHMDEFTLQRYVTARPASVEEAAAMFLGAMVWRTERGVAKLFAELHPAAPDHSARWLAARAHFYGGYSGAARDGSPVFVESLGQADLAGISREEGMLDVMLDAYVQYLESVFRVVRAASAASGTLVRAFIVVDCSGLSLSTIRNIGVIKKVASIGPQYYAESTRCVWIVNAPTLFAAAWAAVGPLLPAHTRKKVNVLGSGFLPTVSEHIDPSQLPEWLGGTKPTTACPRAAPVPEGAAASLSGGA